MSNKLDMDKIGGYIVYGLAMTIVLPVIIVLSPILLMYFVIGWALTKLGFGPFANPKEYGHNKYSR